MLPLVSELDKLLSSKQVKRTITLLTLAMYKYPFDKYLRLI